MTQSAPHVPTQSAPHLSAYLEGLIGRHVLVQLKQLTIIVMAQPNGEVTPSQAQVNDGQGRQQAVVLRVDAFIGYIRQVGNDYVEIEAEWANVPPSVPAPAGKVLKTLMKLAVSFENIAGVASADLIQVDAPPAPSHLVLPGQSGFSRLRSAPP